MSTAGARSAARVGAGILFTRLLGFVRERIFAHYFGIGPTADAFRAALKIPNVIRNLLGEGTLSASFIPVYAGLLERKEEEAAGRLAGTIATLILLITAAALVLGILLAPAITSIAAPGFTGPKRDLTIILVRIMFPMSGFMICSAWCLGILNTHRRFFLSYAAPAAWNIAQIAVLLGLGGYLLGRDLVVALAWGALAGAVAQLAVQLPSTVRLLHKLELSTDFRMTELRTVISAWVPVIFGAGVYQISGIVETQLASLLGEGAVANLGYANLLTILPISLFGISVAAAALPEMSRDAAVDQHAALRVRIVQGADRVWFYVVPSAFAFALLGRFAVGALFQTGEFGPEETARVSAVLAAYAIGLPALASVKLFASGHYAVGDTRTPVKIAALSIAVSATAAVLLMRTLGPPGIALGSSIGAYVNVMLNYRSLAAKLELFKVERTPNRFLAILAGAGIASLASAGVARAVEAMNPWGATALTFILFGTVYVAVTMFFGHPGARELIATLSHRKR